MLETREKIEGPCVRDDVSAYIDRELSSIEEKEFEFHLSSCKSCAEKLQQQKRLLCALTSAFEAPSREFSLPENFTRRIITKAESNVNGLRDPGERKWAFIFCLGLFAAILIALGNGFYKGFSFIGGIASEIWAVFESAFEFLVAIGMGLAVIFKAISGHIIFNHQLSTIAFAAVFVVVLVLFSRVLFRYHRA